MLKKRKKNIIVISHDAGGAEIVSAHVKRYQKQYNFYCYLAGPALKVFTKRHLEKFFLPLLKNKDTGAVFDSVGRVDCLVASTSWSSDIERQFLCEAKKRGIHTISYLDHWANYRERFGYPDREWKKNLPDEIWVGDSEALTLAKKLGLPKIKLVPNQYFAEIRAKIKRMRARRKGRCSLSGFGRNILFISEPVARGAKKMFNDSRHWGFTEKDVLRMVCRSVEYYNQSHKSYWRIFIRSHPSDSPYTYKSVIGSYLRKVPVAHSKISDLVADINRADLIIGMESTALVVGLLANKKAISFIPSTKKRCRLPFKKIIKIRQVSGLSRHLVA